MTKTNFFQLNFAKNDEGVGEKYFYGSFSSFMDPLTRSLSNGFQKHNVFYI